MLPTRFWNREYIVMCVVNLLVTLSLFMQFPLAAPMFPVGAGWETAVCVCLFCVGMFLLGPFNAYFVDAYKRKTVCLLSIAALALVVCLLPMCNCLALHGALRLVQGAACATFQMALGSTLINDLSISKRRTATDYFYTWFGLLGIPLGVSAAQYVLSFHLERSLVLGIWGILLLISFLLLLSVQVPFRAPDNVPLLSSDRFFHRKAFFLIVNLLPVAMIIGFFITGILSGLCMLLMALGVLVGMFTHRLFFVEADNRADAVVGLVLVMVSVVMFLNPGQMDMTLTASIFMGLGLSLFASRMLLYFLKISDHCQRGTLQHTYLLTLMTGIGMGCLLSHLLLFNIFIVSGVLAFSALLYFLFVSHPWFVRKNGREFRFKEI
ncbi:MAG: hypothetical protein ILA34_00225 [Bacteroidaceae bacterium]|nr:hypothetical protein [Bacteroidaceae bacterium]